MLVLRLFLVTAVSLPVYADDVTTFGPDDPPLPVPVRVTQHPTDTDEVTEDHRQGRMSLHSELLSSMEKREQARRSFQAARRRQILGQRLKDQLRELGKPRPRGSIPKDIVDVLEVQESRHGVYITAPVGVRAEIAIDDNAPETLTRAFIKTASEKRASGNENENATAQEPQLVKQIAELKNLSQDNVTTFRPDTKQKLISGQSRNNYLFAHRNSSTVPKLEKISEHDRGRNNTVPMSESLYNHFRPVESNIPVEDMSQFLYFGQKLHPESQNTTSSNTVEITPTVPSAPSPRRRFSMKRFSTTTPIPVGKLEEIINEEMNIAVEKQTVEKNKIPKLKNSYRSLGSGLYFRKLPVRPSHPAIVSNVIVAPKTRNGTETKAIVKSETDPQTTEFPVNPSAHAKQDQVSGEERGSASHEANASRNAADSTQISNAQRYHSSLNSSVEKEGTKNESQAEDMNSSESGTSETSFLSDKKDGGSTQHRETLASSRENQMDAIRNQKHETEDMMGEHSQFSKMTESVPINGHSSGYFREPVDSEVLRSQGAKDESNAVKDSTNVDAALPQKQNRKSVMTETRPDKSTTLRIVVPETATKEGPGEPVGSDKIGFSNVKLKGLTQFPDGANARSIRNNATSGGSPSSKTQSPPPAVAPVQQHVYAYTITNVTRLLRNYTGPGVSKEEHVASAATVESSEISNGPRRGIEAAQSRSQVSAGTAAEGDTTLVGNRVRAAAASLGPATNASPNVNTASVDSEVGESVRADSLSQSLIVNRSPDKQKPRDHRHSTDFDPLGDQPVLQKSASAVLNQRPSDSYLEVNDFKKGSTLRQATGNGHRSSKEPRVKTDDPELGQSSRRRDPDTAGGSQKEATNSVRRPSNAMQNRGFVKFANNPQGLSDKRDLEEEMGEISSDVPADRSLLKASGESDHMDSPIEPILNVTLSPQPLKDEPQQAAKTEGEQMVERVDSDSPQKGRGSSTVNTRGERGQNKTNSAADEGGDTGSTDSGIDSDTDKNVSDYPSEGRSTEKEMDAATTMSPKEIVQSTMTPVVFPVTPKMASDPNRVSDKDVYTGKPEEAVTEMPEGDRPFGIAEDLSPSEIQKRYRSPNTVRPEAITTVIPEAQGPEGEPVDRKTSMERSPEVRGRNLSDKTKEKDDILPIMHLYNTSSIFNGTNSVDSSAQGTGSQHVALPVEGEPNGRTAETSSEAAHPTTIPVLEATTAKSTNAGEPRSGHNTHAELPDSIAGQPGNSTRGKDEANHEATNATPTRGSNFSHTNANRTRTKPTYHPFVPKSNATLFNPELNRTYFEQGQLSNRSREQVNISEVISRRHDGETIATQETVAVVSYILATLVVFPIAVGVGLILRRLIIRNRKVLEESDTSSEISCRKDAHLENGDFKTSIEKAITKLPRIQHLCHDAEKPPPPPPLPQESTWEFPRDKLRLQTVLGQGNFGQVWKAEADDLTGHQGTTRLVAVKTVKEGASSRETEDLVRELEIMQQLGNHPNVVTLLGCCTEAEPHYLILEYVMYGKLLAYLRDHRTRQDFYNFSEDSAALTSRDLTVFGYCVARGMEYLASKKIIHRDLAARNVLVDHNKLCKIADFGMSRFANEDGEVVEVRHGRNALPIRWMAPESLIYSLFTTKTDVWSFGILMWEIVTLGSTPYPDMTAREVMRNVQNGYRLERPSHCRSELFRVISRCWHADPDRRPEFQTLRRDLAQLLEDNMNGHYVDLESFASECTD